MPDHLTIVLAVHDRERAARLRSAFELAQRPAAAIVDPFRQRGLLQCPHLADVVVLDGGEWATLHRRYRTFGVRLHPDIRVIVVVEGAQLASVLNFPHGINGVIQLNEGEALRTEQIDLAVASYSCFHESGLAQLIGASSRRDVLETLRSTERRVLELLGRGYSNRDIAATIKCSETRAKSLVRAVLAKLGVRNRTIAGVIAARLTGRRLTR